MKGSWKMAEGEGVRGNWAEVGCPQRGIVSLLGEEPADVGRGHRASPVHRAADGGARPVAVEPWGGKES